MASLSGRFIGSFLGGTELDCLNVERDHHLNAEMSRLSGRKMGNVCLV